MNEYNAICANTHLNRSLLSYYVSAIVILLARILHTPTHSFAYSDMDLVRPQIQLLNSLAENQSTEEIARMREFCNELARRAQIALDGSHPPTEAQELAARQSQQHETTLPPPAYGFQADDYINQILETNSVVLVCQRCSIQYSPIENESNFILLKNDLLSSNIHMTNQSNVSNSESWMLDSFFDTDFGNMPLDNGHWTL